MGADLPPLNVFVIYDSEFLAISIIQLFFLEQTRCDAW